MLFLLLLVGWESLHHDRGIVPEWTTIFWNCLIDDKIPIG
jgi:hypothetical protein